MKKMKWMLFILLAVAAGCKTNDRSLPLLRAQEWQMKSMVENDTTIKNPSELPRLIFTDSSAIYGSAGCNRFFGTYRTDNRKLHIKTGGVTMMYCPDMPFEDRYLKALNEVADYTVSEKELKLIGKSGKLKIIYIPMDTTTRVGVAKDAHGCNAAAGYTWSEVRQNCVRLFEEGVQFEAVAGQDTTLAAYVIFSTDSLNAEVFLPQQNAHPVLKRHELPKGGFAWNEEDDETLNVRQAADGKWIIEKRGELLYSQTNK